MSKINVVSEGREGVWLPGRESLMEWILSKGIEWIHCMLPSNPLLISADWDVGDVLRAIQEADRVALLTGDSLTQNFRHGLSVITDDQLYMFDIGRLTENDLEIAV
jgi:hypothetical protein